MSARFLIAKYAPDLSRMEPKNIGVIVWQAGYTDSLFLGEDPASRVFTGIPRRLGVKDSANYQRWIVSWRRQLNKPALELDHGKIINRESPEFVDGLREWTRAHYMLVDGGEAEAVDSPCDLPKLTKQLFEALVAVATDEIKPEAEAVQLKAKVIELWKTLGVWGRSDFRLDQPVQYSLFGQAKLFSFDYAFGPSESPHAVGQRVILEKQHIFDGIFMNLEHYRSSRSVTKDRCAAFVLPNQATRHKEEVETNLKVLQNIATVIDLSNPSQASMEASHLASKDGT